MPADEQPKIELVVKNFGPIAEAKIDRRPLTVFVGPSNTGKSYLATLLHALHGSFAGRIVPGFRESRSFSHRGGIRTPFLNGEQVTAVADWATELFSVARPDRTLEDQVAVLSPTVADLVSESVQGAYGEVGRFTPEVARCFGIDQITPTLIRERSRGKLAVTINATLSAGMSVRNPLSIALDCSPSKQSVEVSIGDVGDMRISRESARDWLSLLEDVIGDRDISVPEMLYEEYGEFVGQITESLLPSLLGPLSETAHYLPAGRTGIMEMHRSMAGAMIQRSSMVGIEHFAPIPSAPGVTADLVANLVAMRDDSPFGSPSRSKGAKSVASLLESELLGGSIEMRRDETNYPVYYYRHHRSGRELPLSLTSSMVSELAPVTLYLRNLVSCGETLILDEPESHLHPAAQVEFATHLARVVQSGVRVIVTTHSEWILDQFANLVRMSQLPKEERDGLDGADAALTPDQFGAWLFESKNRPKGTVVREIDTDPAQGGLGRDYFDTAMLTHNTWAEIGNRLSAPAVE